MWGGSAVVFNRNTLFVTPSASSNIFCYKVREDKWTKLKIACPQKSSGLTLFFFRTLVAVGGLLGDKVTGKVLTLRIQSGEWREELPPLAHPRYSPAVVSMERYLVVIGGNSVSGNGCCSVELLHSGDPTWTSLASLSMPTFYPSATLIEKHLFVIANKDSGYFCSLTDLPTNKELLPRLTWQSLPRFPSTVRHFTPSSCSLGGQLIIVDDSGRMFQLQGMNWKACGTLSGGKRALCLLASLSPNSMAAIGSTFLECDDIVDICNVASS